MSRPVHRRIRTWIIATSAVAIVAGVTVGASAASAQSRKAEPSPPVRVTVFSPGSADRSGTGGVGFIVDLALDSASSQGDQLLSAAHGYKPFFNDPAAKTFHPGADPGSPGLVVLLSSTPNVPGTPFHGPRTNLAGLFQINGVARVGGHAETWSTWQPGKPIFGRGKHVVLTVFVVMGTAPALVPSSGLWHISNTVYVPFTIAP